MLQWTEALHGDGYFERDAWKKRNSDISWVPTNTQIAHSLTKKRVPSFKILGFISEPKESSVWCCYTLLFSFAELMPYRNEKKKGEELLSHASYLPWYSQEKTVFC